MKLVKILLIPLLLSCWSFCTKEAPEDMNYSSHICVRCGKPILERDLVTIHSDLTDNTYYMCWSCYNAAPNYVWSLDND